MRAEPIMHAAKEDLRQRMLARRRAVSDADVMLASARAAAAVIALPAFAQARVVALYAPQYGERELETAVLWSALRERDVTVAYPRVVTRGAPLRFHAVDDDTRLQAGKLGIPQPPAHLPEVALATFDLIVVPGVAFDARGGRLGHGAGYYDLTLAAAPRALRVGFAHEFQVVDEVPANAADQPVDVIVTEVRTVYAEPGRVR